MTSTSRRPKSNGFAATRLLGGAAAYLSVLINSLILVAVSAFLIGCGGSSSETNGAVPDKTETGAAETTVQSLGPQEWATSVSDTWAQAMQDLVALLEDRPAPETVLTQVEELRERYIQELVQLGQSREKLSVTERAQADALTLSALRAHSGEAWFTAYNELWKDYADLDLELANVIASFNILTQYADFELLKQQSPEEAARLGIE